MLLLTNLLLYCGILSNKKPSSNGNITWHYSGNYIYFECDRNKNTECKRAKRNIQCGDCKGTKNILFALVR